ncbi:hypothetical protein CPB97_004213 [Podila verticillata]|nr:hypothetical protein CPB97_004213 [Podila verticillata]
MNLSAILNDPPGTSLPATNHSRTKSGAPTSPSHEHRFDNPPIPDDYYDHRSNGHDSNNNTGYHHNDANNVNTNTSYSNGSESRKHANPVSVNQLEQLSALSNGNENSLNGPNHDHPMNQDYHPSESGKGKIRPNESNNTYSTSTFRAAPRASFANGRTTSPPSSSVSSSPVALSSSSSATFHSMTTATTSPLSSVVPTTAITATQTTTASTAKEPSTNSLPSNSPIAKKKPRQQEIVFSSSDPSHDPDGRSSKKKPGRKTSTPTSGHDDPFEIRFVITDKDGLDKSKNAKASASSSLVTTPATVSTPQDSQDEDTGDQDTSESSPQPDFERNAEGKYRCSWPRCGKEFTVASRLTTHYRIHNGKPPYLCGYKDCQKAFHTSSSLSHHRVVHTDQGLRPYICRHNRCGATYTQLARLITHQRTTHSGMILFIPQPNAQGEGTTGGTGTGTGIGTGIGTGASTPSSSMGPSNTTTNNIINTNTSNTPTSTSPSTPSGAPISQGPAPSNTISPTSPRDRQRGVATSSPVSMSGTSGTISPMGEPSRSPHEPPHDKNNAHRAYPYAQQTFSPTSGHGYPSTHGQPHRAETFDGRYEHPEQGPRDRPGDGYGPAQPRGQYSQDDEFDNEEDLSPEERSRREAALTMTSFREIAMVQQQQPPPPPPQQHPGRADYFGEQYFHGQQPSNKTLPSRPGEYWNQQGDHGMEVDRGYSNYDDRHPSSSPGHPQYPNDRFYPGSNEHQSPNNQASRRS